MQLSGLRAWECIVGRKIKKMGRKEKCGGVVQRRISAWGGDDSGVGVDGKGCGTRGRSTRRVLA